MHPANLALRFLLELMALSGFATLMWTITQGVWRYGAAGTIVILLAAIWAVFAVPDDPSRSGSAPVPVPGALRLLLEFVILLGGAWAFHASGNTWLGLSVAALVIVHYLLWPDRLVWLLHQ